MIPKKNSPESLGDLRNISCTMLASKIYESYVLDWIKGEVTLRTNQYGGVRGVSTDHVLVQMWQEILYNLEDYRAATVVTSVDYVKAFNRISYQHCLAALAKNGASTDTLRLIATFLTNRTMMFKLGQRMSVPRQVSGGCPQGSILGVFNATIDDLEQDCPDLGYDGTGSRTAVTDASNSSSSSEDNGDPDSSGSVDPAADGPLEMVRSVWAARLQSTPKRQGQTLLLSPRASPVLGLHALSRKDFKKKKIRRLKITEESRLEILPEPNHQTEAK